LSSEQPGDVQVPGPRLLGPPRKRRQRGTREEGARGALIAAASTVIFIGLALWVVLNSEAWPQVQRQFFSWDHFKQVFPDILGAFWLDVQMFMVAEVVILVFALAVAMVRSLRGPAFFPLRALAVVYIDIIRGVPVLLLILLLGFGIPALQLQGVPNSPLSGVSRP
jgi:polar amino acid transport system permease protein